MDAPALQYARTSDGYDIAYTVSGSGPALVWMPAHFNHTVLDWEPTGGGRTWIHSLSECFQVVHYDSRGQGMSSRGLHLGHSIYDYERDLEAVVERAGLKNFVLVGFLMFGHVAMRYAARHPERVQALALLNCFVHADSGVLVRLSELARTDWDGFIDVVARTITGNWDPAIAKARHRASVEQADYLLQMEARRTSSVEDLARALTVPTLLFAAKSTSFAFGQEPEARRLATMLPDSRLALFDDPSAGMTAAEGQMPPNILALKAFLAELASRPATQRSVLKPLRELLSEREIEVLRLIAAGRTSREIGEALVLSVRTVERHIANIYLKTDTHGRAQVTAYALGMGIA